jgi:hypothetical protein
MSGARFACIDFDENRKFQRRNRHTGVAGRRRSSRVCKECAKHRHAHERFANEPNGYQSVNAVARKVFFNFKRFLPLALSAQRRERETGCEMARRQSPMNRLPDLTQRCSDALLDFVANDCDLRLRRRGRSHAKNASEAPAFQAILACCEHHAPTTCAVRRGSSEEVGCKA